MKKVINPQAIAIQRRFFEALEYAISTEKIAGLKTFCTIHSLNRVKYQNIKTSLQKNDESAYKCIDIDALQYICTDAGISPEWLLFGRGDMLQKK